MPQLSSASLFHFTNSLDTLKQILAHGFKPFYSSEDLTLFGVQECHGIPMVSFCDIPLSRTRQHAAHYGRYALGLRKSWGMERNVVPVHYIYHDSICATIMLDIYKALPPTDRYPDCSCMKFDTRTAIFFYGKPYTGELRKRNDPSGEAFDKTTVTFYDEREWRYVPFADQRIRERGEIPPDVRTMLSQKEYETDEILSTASTTLHHHYKLEFGPEHLRYLIVDKETEIPELVDFITGAEPHWENKEMGGCTNRDKKQLMARILSMQQIYEDF